MDDAAQEHYCSLCSLTFSGAECHSGCPFAKGCRMVRCPRCGYEFVDESTIVNLFRKMFRPTATPTAPPPTQGIDKC